MPLAQSGRRGAQLLLQELAARCETLPLELIVRTTTAARV
jgi:DNA-binding LacI/PurR family transcriptional regulator